MLVFRCDVDFKNSAAWEWLNLPGLNSVPCQSHTLTLEPEKVAPDTVLCLCPCTALCQRAECLVVQIHNLLALVVDLVWKGYF